MGIHTISEAKEKKEVWFKGNKHFFTGIIETIYGGLFAEASPVKGSKKVWITVNETGEVCPVCGSTESSGGTFPHCSRCLSA